MQRVQNVVCSACGHNITDGVATLDNSWSGEIETPRSESTQSTPVCQDQTSTVWASQSSIRQNRICERCDSANEIYADFCSNCGLPFQRKDIERVPGAAMLGTEPAGFWIRFFALILDNALIISVGAIVWPLVFGDTFWTKTETNMDGFSSVRFRMGPGENVQGTIVWTAYFIIPVWLVGGTVGKKLLGITIVDSRGNKPHMFRAVLRYIGWYASGLTLFVGFLIAAFRADKRALHDLIAGTYVTRK